jgi:hypothetical protein
MMKTSESPVAGRAKRVWTWLKRYRHGSGEARLDLTLDGSFKDNLMSGELSPWRISTQ